MFDPNKHHRRSVRLRNFDYRSAGAYFVTVCVARRRQAFGYFNDGGMRLHPYGKIAIDEWLNTESRRPEIALDEFVVMPNHFHAIVWIIDEEGAKFLEPDSLVTGFSGEASLAPTGLVPKSLGAIVGGWKSAVTRRMNEHRAERGYPPVEPWQRSFHDRVIRDERELLAKRQYIIDNPLNWESDEFYT